MMEEEAKTEFAQNDETENQGQNIGESEIANAEQSAQDFIRQMPEVARRIREMSDEEVARCEYLKPQSANSVTSSNSHSTLVKFVEKQNERQKEKEAVKIAKIKAELEGVQTEIGHNERKVECLAGQARVLLDKSRGLRDSNALLTFSLGRSPILDKIISVLQRVQRVRMVTNCREVAVIETKISKIVEHISALNERAQSLRELLGEGNKKISALSGKAEAIRAIKSQGVANPALTYLLMRDKTPEAIANIKAQLEKYCFRKIAPEAEHAVKQKDELRDAYTARQSSDGNVIIRYDRQRGEEFERFFKNAAFA